MNLSERRRALRVPFIAATTITDVISEQQISVRTSDLSMEGCFVTTQAPSSPGAKVWITIVNGGLKVAFIGNVVHARGEGMGVTFTKMELRDRAALDKWIGRLRSD